MSASEVPSGLTRPSVAARGPAGSRPPVAPGGWFSGAEQLESDTKVMLLLLREARNRACARLFGVSERDAGLVTIIALALLAQAANRKAHEVLRAIGAVRRSDAWLGEGALNEGFYRLAGDSSRDVPVIGSLILASVLLHRLRPVLRVSLHDLRVGAQRVRLDFDHRYGHLIRPNRQPRQPPAIEELRTVADGIYPPLLRSGGLADALRSVAIRAPITIDVVDEGIGRCAAAIEAAIYFCSLEAIQNATKHAGANPHVTVTLGRDQHGVHFAIADNGVGMDPDAQARGAGLTSMRDRMGAVGGELEIISSRGGTIIGGAAPDAGPRHDIAAERAAEPQGAQ